MPQAVGYFIAEVLYAAVQIVGTYGSYIAAAAAVASAAQQANTAAQQKNRARQLAGQRDVTVRSTTAPRAIVYGRARVSGPVVYSNTKHAAGSTNNTNFYLVVALAGHECADFEDVWIDDLHTVAADINWTTDGAVNSGSPLYSSGTAHASFFRGLGTTTQTALSALTTPFGTDITSDFRGRGVAYVVGVFNLNSVSRDIYTSAPNQFRVLVKGKKVYDPRRDPAQASYGGSGSQTLGTASTYEWSENPILCIADYLMDTDLGMGVPSGGIDWNVVADNADICDATVSIPGPSTQKRYTCNGQLFTTNTYRDNLEALLSSCNGRLSWVGGKFRIRAGAYETPSVTLTAHDIIGDVQVRTAPQRQDRFNTVRGIIWDPSQQYQEIEFGEMTDSAMVTRDGGEKLYRDLVLPFTNHHFMAQRIAFKQLAQSDNPIIAVVPVNLRGLKVAVGDFVQLTLADLGWSSKVFRCINWESGEEGIRLTLQEDSSGAYADPDVADYVSPTTLPTITTPDVHSDGTRTIAGPNGSFTWVSADGGATWDPTDDTQSVTLTFLREGLQVASVVIDGDLDTATGNINLTDGTHTGESVTVTIHNDNTYAAYANAVHDDSGATAIATFLASAEISGVTGGGGGGK